MKKLLAPLCILITIALILATACQASNPADTNSSDEPQASHSSAETSSSTVEPRTYEMQPDPLAMRVKPQTNEALAEYYLELAQLSGMLGCSWTDAGELSPDAMMLFYYCDTLLPKHPYGWFELELPAEEVEPAIMHCFDVTSEHLRQANAFRLANRSYSFGYGTGSATWASLDNAIADGSTLSLQYTLYDALDQATGNGTLQVETTDSEAWRFVSCKYKVKETL